MIFRRNSEFVVERVMQDFLHVVPIREHTVHDGISASRQTQHSNRSHQGVRGRPRRSTTGVYSEVATPRREQHTFEQRHLERKWLRIRVEHDLLRFDLDLLT